MVWVIFINYRIYLDYAKYDFKSDTIFKYKLPGEFNFQKLNDISDNVNVSKKARYLKVDNKGNPWYVTNDGLINMYSMFPERLDKGCYKFKDGMNSAIKDQIE